MIEIQKNISLKPYNTFAVDVQADFFAEVKNEQDILDLISTDIFATQPHLILGGGANILFTKDYAGLVVKVSLMGKKMVKEEDNKVYVQIGAGENRHEIMIWSLEQGYVGGENLVSIPGQVGSAPVGNIGAYGKEVKDIIYAVEGIDIATKEKKVRTNNECIFGYRESIFKNALKNKIIITAVTFIFAKQSSDYAPNIQYNDIQENVASLGIDTSKITAQEVANIIITIREGKLPDRKKIGTAGSFFKNPVVEKDQFEKLLVKYPQLKGNEVANGIKLSAGQLIEFSGFKGKSEGPVATYDKHALIIVNNGGASGPEIRTFAQSIQKKVLELFDISLEPEVIIM
ncbi:MAG: UDP-N-acetylmuramate dehydrogenase [candidate division SR1 bacterium]|nr:UDP-N-acetylmuramate dehydrogenase [candidate division SR1 bacterium]